MRLSVFLLILCTTNASAAVYKWTDQNGGVHYSDRSHAGAAELNAEASASTGSNARPGLRPAERHALRRIQAEEDARLKAREQSLEDERLAKEARLATEERCYRLKVQIRDYQQRLERGGSQTELDRWQKQIDLYRSRQREHCDDQ